ncbi:hypothetical protein BSKO_00954 [Bryopsis sp. KO-2023]|nr:hypothetical protein BSKO_00954 [Bryopsis sp. KO-2023]
MQGNGAMPLKRNTAPRGWPTPLLKGGGGCLAPVGSRRPTMPSLGLGGIRMDSERSAWVLSASIDDKGTPEFVPAASSPDELSYGIALPRRSAGKKRKVFFLLATAAMEYFVTSSIMWSPMAAALTFILFTPSDKELKERDMDLVERARSKAMLDYWRKIPATPKESAEWVNMLVQGLWSRYVQLFVIHNNLGLWQEKIAALFPDKWEGQISDFDLGESAPTISDVQVLNDSVTGKLRAIDMKVAFDTGTFSTIIVGSGPLGKFTVSISSIRMTGNVRILPVFDHRMLMYSFKEAPKMEMKMGVRGPAIGAMDIPQFDFLKKAIRLAISDLMVEPRRGCISLDYEPIGRRAVDAQCYIEITDLKGIVASLSSNNRTSRPAPDKVRIAVTNVGTKVRRATQFITLSKGAAKTSEKLSINLGDMGGVLDFKLEAEKGKGKNGNGNGNGNGKKTVVLGSYRLNVGHLGDGTTGFWSVDEDWRPVACRWKNGSPWEVTLPVEKMSGASVGMKISMGEWIYMQPFQPLTYRSKGERTVIIRVLEARDLVAKDLAGTSDPYVKLNYNSRTYRSRIVYKTLDPIWNDTFVFSENSSLISRKVRGEVWDKDFTSSDDREGFFFVDLDLATEGQVIDRWFQLAGEESGEVRIMLTIVPGVKSSKAVKDTIEKMREAGAKASVPTVTVNVMGAKDLKPWKANKKSDPFCVVRYGDLEQRTPIVKSTVKPVWDFHVTFPYDPSVSNVKVECLHKDTFRNESEGSIELDINQLAPEESDRWEEWIPLKKAKQGEIHVGIQRRPENKRMGEGDARRVVKVKPSGNGATTSKVKSSPSTSAGESSKEAEVDKASQNDIVEEDGSFMQNVERGVDDLVKTFRRFMSD